MRAIFLDRDGVICENRAEHVTNWEKFRFLPGVKSSLAALSRLGLPIIIVTNQAIINRKMATVAAVEDIHRRMVNEIEAFGGRIDRVIYCPHRPDEKCGCRKPEPGMLVRAANEMGIDLTCSYMVGDAVTDLQAGLRVNCRVFLVLTGRGLRQLLPAFHIVGDDFTIARNLMGATSQILKAEVGLADDANLWSVSRLRQYQNPFPVQGQV